MHITPFQSTPLPGSASQAAGAPVIGTQPFTLDAIRPPVPSTLVASGEHAASDPVGSPEVDSLHAASDSGSDDLKEAFQDFVGQTFFGEMIKSFRTTQQPSKYFHGGRAEEIFQGQFDQVLTEKLSDASSDKIADPMYELFMLKRSS